MFLYVRCSLVFTRVSFFFFCVVFKEQCGGDEENRTPDPLLARQVLSQLSYTPTSRMLYRVRILWYTVSVLDTSLAFVYFVRTYVQVK